jgi:hypothetical protein
MVENASPPQSTQMATGQRVARQSIHEQYLQKSLEAVASFGFVLSNLNGITDQRPRLVARHIVNMIVDDDIRHTILIEFDRRIAEINAKDEHNEWKANEICKLSSDVVGEAISYLDEYLNIHKTNSIEDA